MFLSCDVVFYFILWYVEGKLSGVADAEMGRMFVAIIAQFLKEHPNDLVYFCHTDSLRSWALHKIFLRWAHDNQDLGEGRMGFFEGAGRNHDNKTLVASVGEVNDNIWTGDAQEITFASDYVSSTKTGNTSNHYYLELSNVKVTVANPAGIEQLNTGEFNDSRIFNIVGMQMAEKQLTKGIYTKNGRKVIIR